MFLNNVPKKQSDRIRRYHKRKDLGISFDKSHVLKTFIIFVSVQKKKLVENVGEK